MTSDLDPPDGPSRLRLVGRRPPSICKSLAFDIVCRNARPTLISLEEIVLDFEIGTGLEVIRISYQTNCLPFSQVQRSSSDKWVGHHHLTNPFL